MRLAKAVPGLKKLDLRQNPLKDAEELCIQLFPSLVQVNGKSVAQLRKTKKQNEPKDFPMRKTPEAKRNKSKDRTKTPNRSPSTSDQELLKEIKKLQAENTELKVHNNKLVEELAYKSKLIIARSKDLAKNNERLVELEQELAMCKLESISAQNATVSSQAIANTNMISGIRSTAELNLAGGNETLDAGKELESEIEIMRERCTEFEAKIEECNVRLKFLSEERHKLDNTEKEHHWQVLQYEERKMKNAKCKRKEQLREVLRSSEYFRKRSIILQREIVKLKSILEAEYLCKDSSNKSDSKAESTNNLEEMRYKLAELEAEYQETIEGLEKATVQIEKLDYCMTRHRMSESSLDFSNDQEVNAKYCSTKGPSIEMTQTNLKDFQEEENVIEQRMRYAQR